LWEARDEESGVDGARDAGADRHGGDDRHAGDVLDVARSRLLPGSAPSTMPSNAAS
jgi:hypothetical protein